MHEPMHILDSLVRQGCSVRAYANKSLSDNTIIYRLLHFKDTLSDTKSYFLDKRGHIDTAFTWNVFLFMPAGHIGTAQTLVTQTK